MSEIHAKYPSLGPHAELSYLNASHATWPMPGSCPPCDIVEMQHTANKSVQTQHTTHSTLLNHIQVECRDTASRWCTSSRNCLQATTTTRLMQTTVHWIQIEQRHGVQHTTKAVLIAKERPNTSMSRQRAKRDSQKHTLARKHGV